MKKNIMLSITVILVFVTLSSCGNLNKTSTSEIESEAETYNPFEVESSNLPETTQAEFTYKINTEKLIYTGDPLEVEFEIENLSSTIDFEIGLYIYINGVLYKYNTNEDTEESYMHSFKMETSLKKTLKIYFEPLGGKLGDTFYLNVVSVLNPSFVPEIDNLIYGNNYALNDSCYNVPILFQSDSPSVEYQIMKNTTISDISEEIIKNLKANGISLGDEIDPHLIISGLESDNAKNKDKLNFKVSGYGGGGATYYVYIFDNCKPIKLTDNSDFVEMIIEEDQMTNVDIELNIADIDTQSTLYAVAFPVIKNPKDYSIFSVKTNCYFIVK